MKKGFTLIELLAVLIILAIIAIMAVPVVLNIIQTTKEANKNISKQLYLDSVKQTLAIQNLKDEFSPELCEIKKDGNLL